MIFHETVHTKFTTTFGTKHTFLLLALSFLFFDESFTVLLRAHFDTTIFHGQMELLNFFVFFLDVQWQSFEEFTFSRE